MKKLSILALSAVVSIAPAFAEVNSTATPAKTTAQEVDLSFAFDDVESLQTKEMTATEMQETEGAALPLAYYGVVYGVPAMYAGARWASGNGPQLLSNKIRKHLNK